MQQLRFHLHFCSFFSALLLKVELPMIKKKNTFISIKEESTADNEITFTSS